MKKLQLYVWTDFEEDFTAGLAFAIARSEEEAKQMVRDDAGWPDKERRWGTLHVLPINKPVTFHVFGGG